jgi:succinoglycan biosynthesis transport protein ExoP
MSSSAPPSDRPTLSLGSLLGGARTRWLSALSLGVMLAGGLGAAVWFLVPADYTSSLLLQFRFGQSLTEGDKSLAKEDLENQQRTQLALLRHPRVLEAAVKSETCRDLPTVREQPDPVGWLGRELKAGFFEGTPLMWVSLTGPRPADLAPLLNAVKTALMAEVANAYQRDLGDKRDQLSAAISKAEDDARRRRSELANLRGPVIDPTARTQTDAIATIAAEHARTVVEINRHQTAVGLLKKRLEAVDKEEIAKELIDELVDANPGLQELVKDHDKAVKELQVAEKTSGAGSPALAKYQEAVTRTRKALDDRRKELTDKAVARVRARARTELDLQLRKEQDALLAATAVEASLKKSLDEAAAKAPGPPPPPPPEIDLKRLAAEQSETVLAGLLTARERLEIEIGSKRPRVLAQQDAATPGGPNVRAQAIRAGGAALGGLVVGVLAVGWREIRSRRLRSPGQVAGTGLRVLGAIPAVSRRSLSGAASLAPWNVSLSIALDLLRTTLQLDDNLRKCRSIVVTSAVESEGKSTLATLLAVSLARAGYRTLLIDGDLRYPDLHQKFGFPAGPGLSEVVLRQKWSRAIRGVKGLPLGVMTAGSDPAGAIARLSRVNLTSWIHSLRRSWDYIIIDAPPILPVPEAAVFGKAADGVLVCARAGLSRVEEVTVAVRRLSTLGVNCLGMVMNCVRGEVRAYPADAIADGPVVVAPPLAS